MARTTANVSKRHYRVLHRTPATYAEPADAAAFATFLGTFTELGYCEDKTIKSTIVRGDEISLDTGGKKLLSYNGTLEGVLIQSEVADYAALEAIENIDQDILFYSENSGMVMFFGNALLAFEESVSSGDAERIPFSYEAENLTAKSSFRTRFQEPLV